MGWSGLKHRLRGCGDIPICWGAGGALWKISNLSLNSRVAKSEAQGEVSVTINQEGGIIHNEILCTGKTVSTLNRKSQTPHRYLKSQAVMGDLAASLFGQLSDKCLQDCLGLKQYLKSEDILRGATVDILSQNIWNGTHRLL